jgi:protein-L-isoaspartate(D-aspartate) O-methyltransferase
MDPEKSQLIYDFFQTLNRSHFIDGKYKELAHYDSPLPIGFEQTISQPSLVLEMTLQLDLPIDGKVLEIGTGSGYQTAFLGQFCKEVFTVERIPELSERAQQKLQEIGYKNIKFRVGDGSEGWPEHAPYDRIIVTAAAAGIPEEVLRQLRVGGKMILPLGEKGIQQLVLLHKQETGRVQQKRLGEVRFVELKGKYGWKEDL